MLRSLRELFSTLLGKFRKPAAAAPEGAPPQEDSPTKQQEEYKEEEMHIDPTVTSKGKLVTQVKADLERHEGYREFAYPDVLSSLYKRHPRHAWGEQPARSILSMIGVDADSAARDGAPWTVGHGFTQGVNLDSKMDRLRSERMLEQHILEADMQLRGVLTWYADAPFVMKTVLINMLFNLGLKGLLGFNNTLRFMKEKNYKQAAANMRKSLWYRQVGGRAEELARRVETQTIATPVN